MFFLLTTNVALFVDAREKERDIYLIFNKQKTGNLFIKVSRRSV